MSIRKVTSSMLRFDSRPGCEEAIIGDCSCKSCKHMASVDPSMQLNTSFKFVSVSLDGLEVILAAFTSNEDQEELELEVR